MNPGSPGMAWRSGAASMTISGPLIIGVACAYLGLLFALAYWADRRADQGRSVIGSPTVYALSLAVYCTAWTFYGSVGRAAATGLGFLAIYLGPDPDRPAVGLGAGEDGAGQQGRAHHLHRRLHRLALRQEPVARRPGDGDRGAAGWCPISPCSSRPSPGASPSCCTTRRCGCRTGADPALLAGHRLHRRPAAGRLHHPLRHPPPGRQRAPRGDGGGDRLRVHRQAGRLPGAWGSG